MFYKHALNTEVYKSGEETYVDAVGQMYRRTKRGKDWDWLT